MPYNGSGTFVPDPTAYPAVSGTTVSSSKFNTTVQDIANGLSGAMTRDGQGAATAAMNMGNQKITTVANGTASTDAATIGQVADAVLTETNRATAAELVLTNTTVTLNTSIADRVSKTDNSASQSIVSNFGIGNNAGNRASLDIGTSNATLIDRDIRIGYNNDYYGYRLVNTNNATNTAAGLFKIQRGTSLAWTDVVSIDDKSNVTISGNVSATGAITAANINARTWSNQTSNRSSGVSYTNSSSGERDILFYYYNSTSTVDVVVDGVNILSFLSMGGFGGGPFITFSVPSGKTYKITTSGGGTTSWFELT